MQQHQEEFADELMVLNSLRSGPLSCEMCGTSSAEYRCLDCFSCGLNCKVCIVHQHSQHPLHQIQVMLLASTI